MKVLQIAVMIFAVSLIGILLFGNFTDYEQKDITILDAGSEWDYTEGIKEYIDNIVIINACE